MQFKHSELLYALLLLLIPIFIHLFQLRKFQKTAFTNVAFLKKVNIQTRKSSQLKKWLTLCLRMAAIACLVIAFAQPFSASKTALNTNKETVIYLDNSFSMQAKGPDGPLLQNAMQDLYLLKSTEKITWFTNNKVHSGVSEKAFKAEMLQTDYTSKQLSPKQVLLKAAQLFSKNAGAEKRLIYVSDFQLKEGFPPIPSTLKVSAVSLSPERKQNIALDTIFIKSNDASKITLEVRLTSQGTTASVPVSFYNKEVLLAKTSADFSESAIVAALFEVNKEEAIDGRILINDPDISYDNTLYFSINEANKVNVLAINQGDGAFITRLFSNEKFNYTPQSYKNLDYNAIPNQNFIILNELDTISAPLIAALRSFAENGGSIFVIPSVNAVISEYNSLLSSLRLGVLGERISVEKQITTISFDHPLYQDVFEKRVVNFQYPKVNLFYELAGVNAAALSFEDGKPFIVQKGNHFLSTTPFASEITNFKSSPLIVPTLYNMSLQSLPLPKLYYTTGEPNTFAIPIKLQQDQIITLRDSLSSFIPLQIANSNKVTITTEETPDIAGTYAVMNDADFLENVSFNYDRDESILQYAALEDWEGVDAHDSIAALFENIVKDNTINEFWKWFAIGAFLFLLAEMLVLRFYKK
ncbi:MAG: hypothetical protein ACI836_001000 [Saprospiraceae bacterium]|jgi:hypothetical protein|uniref:BatA domain-containing protein n=1 Tax=Patiriisocius sp. Uisw_047 TaxID=3230969 RepID=UPI0039EC6B2B